MGRVKSGDFVHRGSTDRLANGHFGGLGITETVAVGNDDTRGEIETLLGSQPRRSSRRWIWPFAVIGLGCIVGAGVRARSAAAALHVEMAPIRRGDVRVIVTATGIVEASRTVEVGAEVTGRVVEVLAEPNDVVKKGQILVRIDPEQLEASVSESAAQVAAADAAVQQAQVTVSETRLAFDRASLLLTEKLMGRGDFEAAVATKQRADANLTAMIANAKVQRASLALARSRLEKTAIVAPVTGTVLSRLVELGQTVNAGLQTPVLYHLAEDLTKMRLTVDVDEADVGRVREGQEATFEVEAYPEHRFASRIVRVGNEAKTSRNVVTYEAVLTAENADRLLRPGMTCTASIVADVRRGVLIVPNEALRFEPSGALAPTRVAERPVEGGAGDRKKHVWTRSGSKLVRVDVRVGASDGAVTELMGGDMAEGSEVVIDTQGDR